MASCNPSNTEAVTKFLNEKEYHHVKPLGRGGFGEVLSAVTPQKDEVAIKIVAVEKTWHIEEYIWPVLNHKNILPLTEMICAPDLGVTFYVMPKQPYVLVDVLSSDSFITDKNGFRRVKSWLYDVFEGMKYLHINGFAHLDIKEDNVLITGDDHALLCDFTGLNLTGVPLQRMCAPLKFRPPECYDPSLCKNLEGSQCDIWLYGLMALNVLTDDLPSLNMCGVTNAYTWKRNAEPVLLEALEKSTFCDIVKYAFPYVTIPYEELTSAHDFVTSLMQWDRNKRPSVHEMEGHPFFKSLKSPKVLDGNMKSVVKNPFLPGWNDPEKYNVNVPIQKSISDINERNYILKRWIGPGESKENISTEKGREENVGPRSFLNNSSYPPTEKIEVSR